MPYTFPGARTNTKRGDNIIAQECVGDSCIVLCQNIMKPDEFVVWRMDTDGNCHGGEYTKDLLRACAMFNRRAGASV